MDRADALKSQIKQGSMAALYEYLKLIQADTQHKVNRTANINEFRWQQGSLDATILILDLLPDHFQRS